MPFIKLNNILEIACGYEKIIKDDFFMGPHYHPRVEIMYCLEGEFDVQIYKSKDSSEFDNYHFAPQSYIIIHPNTLHCLVIKRNYYARILNLEFYLHDKTAEEATSSVLSVNFNNLFSYCKNSEFFFDSKEGFLCLTDNGMFSKLLKELVENIAITDDDPTMKIQNHFMFYLTMLEFAKSYSNYTETCPGVKYTKSAIAYIKQNYKKKLSIEVIAEASGINKYYLQKLFRAYINKSVLEVLNDYRIEKCKKILESTDCTIEQLLSISGFTSRQSLLYEFKKATKISPSEYKKLYKNKVIEIFPSENDKGETIEVWKG
jgi:AraC-like DNA-binding protein